MPNNFWEQWSKLPEAQRVQTIETLPWTPWSEPEPTTTFGGRFSSMPEVMACPATGLEGTARGAEQAAVDAQGDAETPVLDHRELLRQVKHLECIAEEAQDAAKKAVATAACAVATAENAAAAAKAAWIQLQ